ncbi:hypothetical protein [Aquihabitans sp. McL0605]|uniref:hypothetical protein n=1 Tax=Aquihabitans sp. McL0605 TaxID=3415671 RepID=UPI003CEE16E2
MVRRLSVAVGAAVMVLGLLAPTMASATVDTSYGWDYRALSVNGTYTMLRGQFAGDDATDLLFYGAGSAPDSLWIGKTGTKGTDGFTKVPLTINLTAVPVVGDFAGDDYDDILFYGKGTNADALYTSTETSDYFSVSKLTISGTNYKPKALLDYRAVGTKDDVLFLGPGSTRDFLWHFTDSPGTADYIGPGTFTSQARTVNGAYQLISGDFNGDYLDDVVLYQPGTAADYKWTSSASGAFTQTSLSISGTYQPVTVRHSQYDGIYWWASGAGNEAYWVSNGTSFVNKTVQQFPEFKGTAATYGGDGVLIRSDQSGDTGRDAYVSATTTSAKTYYLANPSHDFNTATQFAEGDFDGDDHFDTIWYGPGTRKDEVWYGLPAAASAPARSAAASGPEAPAPAAAKVTPIVER